MRSATIFKHCACCSSKWPTRRELLSDSSLKLHGYQANFKRLELGLFLFTHDVPSCRSTLALDVAKFSDLFTGTRYPENKALSPDCPGYCLDETNLERCGVFCACAFVRDIMWSIRTLMSC